MTMQQRLHPTHDQATHAASLLDRVPSSGYDWASKPGQVFLTYALDLVQQGVPVSWLAHKVDLNAKQLHAALDRFSAAQRHHRRAS